MSRDGLRCFMLVAPTEIATPMKRFPLAATALLGFTMALSAQTSNQHTNQNGSVGPVTTTAQPAPAANSRKAPRTPKAPMQETPGGGPGMVWVNTNSSVYHCQGDRFYGRTSHGRYMTEAAAKSAGAKGVGGKTCSTGK